jgi:hypothetical protein
MADQKEVVVYARRPSWRWWLTKRLLRRSGYYFNPSCPLQALNGEG